jgi:hypothetical protein
MADASTVSPVFQLAGTALTVLGGVVVALIARGGKGKNKSVSVEAPITGLHADVILLQESLAGLKVLLLDYWQWARDREEAARERHTWLREKFSEKESR